MPFEDTFLHKPKPGSDLSESPPQANVNNLLFFVAVHFTRREDEQARKASHENSEDTRFSSPVLPVLQPKESEKQSRTANTLPFYRHIKPGKHQETARL